MAEAGNQSDTFRDHLYNVDETGRRVGFHPKKPEGKFYNARTIVSIVLLALLFGMPWIRVNGEQFMMLNFLQRKFVLFGQVFWPQDFYLFVIAAITLIVSIFLFTVVWGRIWCGWACPQTIFLEMVYRKIEYLIEGDGPSQKRLDASPWNFTKIWKKSLKHIVFFFIAFLVANTFVAYLVGTDTLVKYITHSPAEVPITFIAVVIFSGAFYFVFAKFRELACIMVCPYGRLQGVLLDENSVVISYDFKRGEPRGKIKRGGEEDKSLGDCIDCKLCIAVCPTGIDIRNGTQLECVNCTACIDVCDDVMRKVKKPEGLIRYASHKQITEGSPFRFTPRAFAYSGVLSILMIVLGFLLFNRSDVSVSIVRSQGSTYTVTADSHYINMYTLTIVNKSSHDRELELRLEEGEGKLSVAGGSNLLHLKAGEEYKGAFVVELPPSQVKSFSFPIVVRFEEAGKKVDREKTVFLGPMKFK